MLYLIQGMTDKGVKYLEKGLKISPGDPMGSLQLSQIYIKEGRKEEAKKILKKALSRETFNPLLQRNMEILYRKFCCEKSCCELHYPKS